MTAEDLQSLARMEELTKIGLASTADLNLKLAAAARDLAEPTASNEAVSGYAAVYYPGTPQPGNAQR